MVGACVCDRREVMWGATGTDTNPLLPLLTGEDVHALEPAVLRAGAWDGIRVTGCTHIRRQRSRLRQH